MDNSPLGVRLAQTPLLNGAATRTPSPSICSTDRLAGIQLLRGRDALLRKIEMLNDLCARTGQAGATRWLEHQMGSPNERKKIPTLVLVGMGENADAASATADDVCGAVILYEYKIAGRGVKVFAADDTTGQRVVIAPKHLRAQVTEAACNGLVAKSALAVFLTYEGQLDRQTVAGRRNGTDRVCEMATRGRSVPLYLHLGTTFEATLANLGRHTRRNLRYYRRRAEGEMGSEFVPRTEMSRDEFLAMNQASMNPVADAVASWRYDEFSASPGMLFAGVRTRDGRWLSLIGGRRYRQVTEIDWQMNLAGLPRLSLSTVMRSYLLENEVLQGTKTLMFSGGTPHSMRHSFLSVDVVDAIALRQSAGARMLRALAPWIIPKNNFMGQALNDEQMRWVK